MICKKNIRLFLCFFLFVPGTILVAQNQIADNEYVIISCDRSVYLSGETVYFTAFYDNFNPDSPNNLSNVLYLEIYNKRETIVQAKYIIKDKIIRGVLELPDNGYSGNYYLRAYTKFQRNLPAELMHNVLISVINPHEAFPAEDICKRPELEAYCLNPEQTEFAVRFKQANPENVFFLQNSTDSIYQFFQADASGMMAFSDTTTNKQNTELKYISKNGDTLSIGKLHELAAPDVSINASQNTRNVSISISAKTQFIKKFGSDFELIVKNQRFNTVGRRLFDYSDINKLVFDKEIFDKAGIYYFILQNLNSEIIYTAAIYFHNLKDSTTAYFTVGDENLKNREPVEINFTENEGFKYAKLKVVNSKLEKESSKYLPHHISYSHNLLRSRLRTQPVEKSETIEQINTALKLQGAELNSQAFINNVLQYQAKEAIHIADIRDISISGKAVYTQTGKPAADIDVFASVAYGKNQIQHGRTDQSGNFIFSLNNATNRQNVFITTAPQAGDVKLSVLSDFHPEKPMVFNIPLVADTTDLELFKELYVNKQLKQVYTIQINKNPISKDYKTVNFDGLYNYTAVLSDFIKLPDVSEIIHELVTHVRHVKRRGENKIIIFNEDLNEYYENPLILVDFMPIFDIEKLLKTDPERIEKVEVINQKIVIGDYHFEGLIHFTSNTDNFAGIDIPEGSVYLKYAGSQLQEVPIFPSYEQTENKLNPEADFRHVLHYETLSGKLPDSVIFYTSDRSGTYDVIFTGIKANGELVRTRRAIVVK